MKYDDGKKDDKSVKHPLPNPKEEKSIAELFNLSKTQAPNEDHLIRHNALGTWGKKPK